MPNRRTGLITSLLLTALLFVSMPGLVHRMMQTDSNRMAPMLRPPRLRTLTVWTVGSSVEDGKLLKQLCSSFEKTHPGARVFLRRADPEELCGENAVLPDVLLPETGEIADPERFLLPLSQVEMQETSGLSGLVRYAVPLWYQPAYLRYPPDWGDDPWRMLRTPGTLQLPQGLAISQLLMTCPLQHREALVAAAATPGRDAQVVYAAPGEEWGSVPLTPEVSDRVRYAALCRDSEDARAFVAHLMQAAPGDQPLRAAGQAALFPNAFAHTREELHSLCRDQFERCLDPAQTILQLR